MRRTRSHSRPTFSGGVSGRGSRVHGVSKVATAPTGAACSTPLALRVTRSLRGFAMASPLALVRRCACNSARSVVAHTGDGSDQMPSSPSFADSSSGDGAEATFASQRALSQISIVSMTPMITTSRVTPARWRSP